MRQLAAVPNLFTLGRLFLLPFLVINILDARWHLAFVLFLIAGFSDSFDGLLARWLHQRTRLGQYLDPIADKLLLSTLFIVLTMAGEIPRYVTVLVFSRDLGILVISALLYVTDTLRDFRPSWLGKTNTFVQIITLICIMASHVTHVPRLPLGIEVLLRTVAILAPLSAAHYAWVVVRRIGAEGVVDGPEPAAEV